VRHNFYVSRSDGTVKRAFETVFQAMVSLFEESQQSDDDDARRRALAIAGLVVGGMVVARSLESRDLADSLREAAKNIALELGVWSKPKKKSARHVGRP
jgi:hypothetical protein